MRLDTSLRPAPIRQPPVAVSCPSKSTIPQPTPLSNHPANTQGTETTAAPVQFPRFTPNKILFALGVLLTELCLNNTIEAIRHQKTTWKYKLGDG
ncbi:hypothetical protein N657DRAFT_648920 [Parathielavia appendiculata]|uniref:Uncharacterized protein n=1 Tax=Parathielavia appendiculata TaxID=2587402 RepID=A0AAN6Z079_9PEZI|nr:hypothetical protein N657DRAFT_648920 [Parathielavia appendiculata]